MVKRTASEANVDDDCLIAIDCDASMSTESNDTSDDRMMESPIPPLWRHESSVEPIARVRTFPKCNVEQCGFPKGQPNVYHTTTTPSSLQDEADSEMDEVSSLNEMFTPIIAPVARRVVSPELIFQSAAERYESIVLPLQSIHSYHVL